MKKIFTVFTIFIFLITPKVLAANSFLNDIKDIKFDKNTVGKPEIIIQLQKDDNIRVLKKDDLEYVVLLPETSNSMKGHPSLNEVLDIITDVDIKTQPYTGNIKGYTKITIKTSKPANIKAISTTKPYEKPISKKIANQIAEKVNTPKIEILPNQPATKAENKTSNKITSKAKNDTGNKIAAKTVTNPLTKPENKSDKKISTNYNNQNKEIAKKQSEKPIQTITKEETTKINNEVQIPEPKSQHEKIKKEETNDKIAETTVQNSPTEQLRKEVQQEEQAKEPIHNEIPVIPNNKLKSIYMSIGITLILLVLLILLKMLNKLLNKPRGSIKLPRVDESIENTEQPQTEEIDIPSNIYMEELPIHEVFEHKQEDNILNKLENEDNSNIVNEDFEDIYNESINNNIDQDFEQPETIVENSSGQYFSKDITPESEPLMDSITNFEIQTNIQPEVQTNVQTELNQNEIPRTINFRPEISQEPISQPIQQTSSENVVPKVIINNENSSIEIEDIDDNNFNSNISPEDLFGDTEEEDNNFSEAEPQQINKDSHNIIQTIFNKPIAEPFAEINLTNNAAQEQEQKEQVLENNIKQESLNEEIKFKNPESVEINNNITEYVQNNEQIIEEKEESIQETDEDYTEDDIIKSSYTLTPTKSIYLVNYENSTLLMAAIKDEYSVLKKFDEIIDKPMLVRQTDKNSKKTSYIVRIGDFRGIIDVTMKNIELVLEL